MSGITSEVEILAQWSGSLSPLVSICCITYNQSRYISKAIESFLEQKTSFPFEVIVYDDASIDDTLEVIKRYQKLYPNIIKIIAAENNQYSINRQLPFLSAFKASTGKYIALCEGDDFWIDAEHLRKKVEILEKNNEISVAASPCLIFDLVSSTSNKVPIKKDIYSLDCYLTEAPYVATASLVFRTQCINSLTMDRNYFATDSMIKLSCLTQGLMAITKDVSCVYRRGVEGSWSNEKKNVDKYVKEYLDNISIYRDIYELTGSASILYKIRDFNTKLDVDILSTKGRFSVLFYLIFNTYRINKNNFRYLIKKLIKS